MIRYVLRGLAFGLGVALARWLFRWMVRAALVGATLFWLL